MDIIADILTEHRTKRVLASMAEKEVERFLKVFLVGTPFAGKAFAVGGYIRDELLGIDSKDLDIVVEMEGGAEKLTKFIYKKLTSIFPFFKKKLSTPRRLGAGYPIWQLAFKDDITYKGETYKTNGAEVEFADTQTEEFPDEKSRQRKTEYAPLQKDIERRDFTVNMLIKDLTTGEILDPSDEMLEKRFKEDPLRMMRLIRFQVKYDWDIPLSAFHITKKNAERIKIVSSERIMGELKKIANLGKLDRAIELMRITGLLQYVLPEVEALKGVEQGIHHQEGDAYTHTLNVIKNSPPTLEGQFAALLHDIGKPQTQKILDDTVQFLGHEEAGAKIAEGVLERLKFDNKTKDKIVDMVKHHMRPHQLGAEATPKAIRRFIRAVGDEMTDSIINLAEADVLGKMPLENYVPELRKKIEEVRKIPIKEKSILDGTEIMQLLNISGKSVGEAVDKLKEIEDEYATSGKPLNKDIAKEELLKRYKEK